MSWSDLADPLVRDIVGMLTQSFDDYDTTADDKTRRDLATAVDIAVRRFLQLPGTEEPALTPSQIDHFRSLGAGEARDGRGPDVIVAACRAAARRIFREASVGLRAAGLLTEEVTVDLTDSLTTYVDLLASATTNGYTEQLATAGTHAEERARLADLILRGAGRDAIADAADSANWSLHHLVTPLLVPGDWARSLRFRFGARGLVVEDEQVAVLLTSSPAGQPRSRLEQLLPGETVVVGPTVDVQSVPDAVHLARLARRILDPVGETIFVDDHLGDLAVGGDPAALALLRQHRLAPLDSLRDGQRERLLETLDSWLRHWGSRSGAAADLHIHPQTVGYRVTQLRELFGDRLDDPRCRWELQLLLAHHYRGRR